MDVSGFINGISDWQFLQEPLYRWALFFFAVLLFLMVWNGVLSFMKG